MNKYRQKRGTSPPLRFARAAFIQGEIAPVRRPVVRPLDNRRLRLRRRHVTEAKPRARPLISTEELPSLGTRRLGPSARTMPAPPPPTQAFFQPPRFCRIHPANGLTAREIAG